MKLSPWIRTLWAEVVGRPGPPGTGPEPRSNLVSGSIPPVESAWPEGDVDDGYHGRGHGGSLRRLCRYLNLPGAGAPVETPEPHVAIAGLPSPSLPRVPRVHVSIE